MGAMPNVLPGGWVSWLYDTKPTGKAYIPVISQEHMCVLQAA